MRSKVVVHPFRQSITGRRFHVRGRFRGPAGENPNVQVLVLAQDNQYYLQADPVVHGRQFSIDVALGYPVDTQGPYQVSVVTGGRIKVPNPPYVPEDVDIVLQSVVVRLQ